MTRLIGFAAWFAMLAGASTASAQRIEIAPLVGITTSTPIDRKTVGVQELSVDRSLTVGGQGAYFMSTHIGVDALWMYRWSAVRMSTATATTNLFTASANELHGDLVYRFRGDDTAWRPFVLGGFGSVMFDASGLQSEWKPSWTAGAGVVWFARQHAGFRVQARYVPVLLRNASSTFCNPFDFCQNSIKPFEVAGGAAFRF